MIEINKLRPFGRFCQTIGNLPSSYMQSLTFEEQILWFCDFLQNTVIPTVNNNAQAVEELQQLFTELQNYVNNYFDNLDVQEEINNKLDEMAQNGTLYNIMTPYFREIDERITIMENKVDAVASGSPLVASSTSEMTDTSRVYVNTTNGHWYYYNGTNWADGGVYQSAEDSNTIQRLSTEMENITYKSYITHRYKNLAFENINQNSSGNSVYSITDTSLLQGNYFCFNELDVTNISDTVSIRMVILGTNNTVLATSNPITISSNTKIRFALSFNIPLSNTIKVRIDKTSGNSTPSYNVTKAYLILKDNIISNDNIYLEMCNKNTAQTYTEWLTLENYQLPNMIEMIGYPQLNYQLNSQMKTFNNTTPIFNLFEYYENRDVKICMIGDSTTDGNAGPAKTMYDVLKLYQKSNQLLENSTIIDRGSNGSTAEAYIGNYNQGSGMLYNAIQDNADLYIVCLGINDVRQGNCDKPTLVNRLKFIVNEILNNTKGKVILRVPNSLGSDDVNEEYIIPYTSAQQYTNILYDAYEELKNYWSKDKVRTLNMMDLIFGKESIPSAGNPLMGDVLHPSLISVPTWINKNNSGFGRIATVIAEAIGQKPKLSDAMFRKIQYDGDSTNINKYPQLLDKLTSNYELVYQGLTFGGMGSNYLDFYGITPSELSDILKTNDILRFGNKGINVYTGYLTASGNNTRIIGQTFDNVFSMNDVVTIDIYRELS